MLHYPPTYRLESNPLLTLHQQGICWNHSRINQEIEYILRHSVSLKFKRKHTYKKSTIDRQTASSRTDFHEGVDSVSQSLSTSRLYIYKNAIILYKRTMFSLRNCASKFSSNNFVMVSLGKLFTVISTRIAIILKVFHNNTF